MTVIDRPRDDRPRDDRPSDVDTGEWIRVCPLDQLVPGRGVAALLPGDEQVAVFRVDGQSGAECEAVYAVGNIDPFGQAAVMSRGLVGERSGEPTVASPLLKQVFSLRDGRWLDASADGEGLGTYATRVVDGHVDVRLK